MKAYIKTFRRLGPEVTGATVTEVTYLLEGVVAQWCNPLTLQTEQLSGVGSILGRTPPLERHDMGLLKGTSCMNNDEINK